MIENLKAVKFGNGVKTHAGRYEEFAGRQILLVNCGSRVAGTQKRVIGDINLATYLTDAYACDKCVADLAKVGA